MPNKSIYISLVKNDKNMYHADMLVDNKIVKQADLTQQELADYMKEKLEPEILSMSRTAIKLFKSKQIKLNLKD